MDYERLKARLLWRDVWELDLVRKGLWEGSLRQAFQGTEASNGAEGKGALENWQRGAFAPSQTQSLPTLSTLLEGTGGGTNQDLWKSPPFTYYEYRPETQIIPSQNTWLRWSLHQQCQQHLRACEKCRTPGHTPDLLHQNPL